MRISSGNVGQSVPGAFSKSNVSAAFSSEDAAFLAREEARVLRDVQNQTCKADADSLQVRYDYALGPDGKRYITGAHVTYKEEETPASTERKKSISETEKSQDTSRKASSSATYGEDPEVRAAVQELQSVDREVRAHEAAHMAVGGQYAGSASYTYTLGPDGKRYAVGGEVPISAPKGSTPEETIRIMRQVQAAALAPGNPSGQDRQVAAAAASAQAEARRELYAEETREGHDPEKLQELSEETNAAFGEERVLNFSGREEISDLSPLRWQDISRAYQGPWVTGASQNFDEFSWSMAM